MNTEQNGIGYTQAVIDRIKKGIVVDHIPPGQALSVLRLLGVEKKEFLIKGNVVAVAINVKSLKRPEKRKDVLKIQNYPLRTIDRVRLGLMVPGATLSVIDDYKVVEKKRLDLPAYIEELPCPSSSCITNQRENVMTHFKIVEYENIPFLKCKYCEEAFKLEEFLQTLK